MKTNHHIWRWEPWIYTAGQGLSERDPHGLLWIENKQAETLGQVDTRLAPTLQLRMMTKGMGQPNMSFAPLSFLPILRKEKRKEKNIPSVGRKCLKSEFRKITWKWEIPESSMVAHTCDPVGAQEMETRSWVQGQPRLHETLSQTNKWEITGW